MDNPTTRQPDKISVVINNSMPDNWRHLQEQVGLILRECGFKCEVDNQIHTVRGTVNVDVYAENTNDQPTTIYICECKHWKSAVSKTIVHAFRTVIADFGANWGFIISSGGFQSGAFEAAANSNVRLLTWFEFQELFVDRWLEHYMMSRFQEEVDSLVEYTEPINSRIFRKADKLNEQQQNRFKQLRKQFVDLAYLALHYYLPLPITGNNRPDLPLIKAYRTLAPHDMTNLPDEVLDANCLRDFVDAVCKNAKQGLAAFDEVFGGRA